MQHSQVDVGGGIELHVAELGEGKPVLFCHGFPDTWLGWRRQMEAVAAAGYRAIAIDCVDTATGTEYDRQSGTARCTVAPSQDYHACSNAHVIVQRNVIDPPYFTRAG
ncbi:alpha/beta fold hydrolase [Kushneria aurantia]|uniref:Alpha/beta fold hydrolase n=1 Tax=Kushneria aurantia TaxID=504092 RepID=A0ABV6G2D9_9GAMM